MVARSTTRIRPIRIWIPPKDTPIYKLEVIRSDGTTDNIS
ncbi:unnamed protein product, partial [marine sediment metagenome]